MYTLRVWTPISLHISVFQKNTGSFRVISGPWHKLFHTVLVAMVTSKAILPFFSISPSTFKASAPKLILSMSLIVFLAPRCTFLKKHQKSIDIGLCEQAPASRIETLFEFFSFSEAKGFTGQKDAKS